MKEMASDLTRRIAGRIKQLRAARKLSLDALAHRSGVSRSMISLIERGESSPTAVVLDKLAASLGVAMASLFDAPAAVAKVNNWPLARRADQPQWRDPDSGYLRRIISPPGVPEPMQIIEVHFPPRARVAFEASRQESHVHQQIWVLEGEIEIATEDERYRLREGDCLALRIERPKMFYNPTRKMTRYAIVVAPEPIFEQ